MTRLDDALLVAAEATALAPRGHALGADPVPGGVRFGVWAPRARAVEVVIEGEPEHAHPLRAGTSGYHSAVVPGAAASAPAPASGSTARTRIPTRCRGFSPTGRTDRRDSGAYGTDLISSISRTRRLASHR